MQNLPEDYFQWGVASKLAESGDLIVTDLVGQDIVNKKIRFYIPSEEKILYKEYFSYLEFLKLTEESQNVDEYNSKLSDINRLLNTSHKNLSKNSSTEEILDFLKSI